MPEHHRIDAAITALLGAKPHLASRTPIGTDIGQGPQGEAPEPGLLDLMR